MPRVSNEGVSIHYRVEGDGPPVVLGHGIGGNREGVPICALGSAGGEP